MRPPVYSLRRMTNSGRYPAPGSPASPRAPDKAAAPSEALRLPLQALPSARGRTWAAVGRRESGCKWGAWPRSGLGHRARASSPTDLLRPRWQEPNERCRVHQTPAMRTGYRPGLGAQTRHVLATGDGNSFSVDDQRPFTAPPPAVKMHRLSGSVARPRLPILFPDSDLFRGLAALDGTNLMIIIRR